MFRNLQRLRQSGVKRLETCVLRALGMDEHNSASRRDIEDVRALE